METTVKKFIIDKKLFIRRLFLIVLDIILINFAAFCPLLFRFEFRLTTVPVMYMEAIVDYIIPNTILTIIIFFLFRLYHSLWKYAGIDEVTNILFSCIIATLVMIVGMKINLWVTKVDFHMPRSYFPLYFMFLTCFVGASRLVYRYMRRIAKHGIGFEAKSQSRIMIIGAGEAANTIINEIAISNYINGKVVCAIDDNPSKYKSYIRGVRIVGNRNTIIENAEKYEITDIIIAMPSAPRKETKKILDICKETGCALKLLPGMYQLINEEVSVTRLRDVEIEDLLGREPVETNLEEVVNYVKDKVVMVTGGGGSIGSELCRQIAKHQPKKLLVIDIYENNAYAIQQELKVTYSKLDLVVLIASVRNTNRMDWIFNKYRPDIVYHAAAHKHVPLMEDSPNEAIKNNVGGTYKLALAAERYHVKKFVQISTDKAVNPTNIMGASKRICEMIIQTLNNRSKTDFVAVRFGNVLGSNGSVIPLFKEQIKRGGPITVTHPDIIRYFMTIPEAVALVLQAGAYAKGGEIFVLDMGEPVKIADLAKNLIRLSGYIPGKDISIVYTGLRPGEKLYEELLMDEEGLQDTKNKLIHIGKPIKLNEEKFLEDLKRLDIASKNETEEIKKLVQEIVPTYVIQEEGKTNS